MLESEKIEVEWQFDVRDLEVAERWLAERGAAGEPRIAPERARRLLDAYYDTPDWRFFRAGYALRLRVERRSLEATLKALVRPRHDIARRLELSVELPSASSLTRSRGPVGEHVRALKGKRPLHRLFVLQTRRLVLEAEWPGGASAEIALDSTRAAGEKRSLALCRIEIEVAPDAVEAVRPFVEEMRAALALQTMALAKFEAGLLSEGLEPPLAFPLRRADRDRSAR